MNAFQQLPEWSSTPVFFAGWLDLLFAFLALLFGLLLVVWWREQTRFWFRLTISAVLASLLLCIASFYLFETPPYYASCPQGCHGWRGYPRPFATTWFDEPAQIAALDFALNWLMLWLLVMVASVVWRLLALAIQWPLRSRRLRLLFVFAVVILPWALLPRFLGPPEPSTAGEDLRLATNARRAAEFTYRITGFWVQRLALEDVRHIQPEREFTLETANQVGAQVCLRGYTYFYVPWRRYRIDLDMSGVTALSLTQLPLDMPCWNP
jgi:hypothetical protein